MLLSVGPWRVHINASKKLSLEHVTKELRDNREVAMAAVQQDTGLTGLHLRNKHCANFEIFLVYFV